MLSICLIKITKRMIQINYIYLKLSMKDITFSLQIETSKFRMRMDFRG